ncbi:MAG TPA: PEP-CTERM sorting domain-containing protein [Bryobacteraceae bacterium]|nr:PEP-CTERM sorting domain-containing protein [Bryobacteraceae bacterium]
MYRHSLIAACLALAAFAPLRANLIQNGSFEISTATTTTQFVLAGVADWTTTDIGQALVFPSWFTNGYLFPPNVGLSGAFPQNSPDGGNFVFSDSDYRTSAIQQTVSGLAAGHTYTLSFYDALDQDTEPNITVPGPTSAYWQVTFGTQTQNTSTMLADGSLGTFTNWSLQSMNFTATSASQVLSFFAVGVGDPPLAMLDGVSLEDTTAPEPAAIALLGGGLALGAWRIRRRKANA